jgi:hypothetical protein
MLNPIFHYQETLQRLIVREVESTFDRESVRVAISGAMTAHSRRWWDPAMQSHPPLWRMGSL